MVLALRLETSRLRPYRHPGHDNVDHGWAAALRMCGCAKAARRNSSWSTGARVRLAGTDAAKLGRCLAWNATSYVGTLLAVPTKNVWIFRLAKTRRRFPSEIRSDLQSDTSISGFTPKDDFWPGH